MKRRDFLCRLAASLPALMALGPVAGQTRTAEPASAPDKPADPAPAYQLDSIGVQDIQDIFNLLQQYRIEQSHLYLERVITRRLTATMESVVESSTESWGGLNLRFMSGKGWVGWSESRYDPKLFRENLDKLVQQYFQSARKKNLAKQKPAAGKPGPAVDSAAVLKDSPAAAEEKAVETIKFKEIKEYREDVNRFPPSQVPLQEIVSFFEQFRSFKNQVIPQVSDITFRWNDYQKTMSSWLQNGEFCRDEIYTAGWEVRCRVDSELYIHQIGGSRHLKDDILGIRGPDIEALFQGLRRRIEGDQGLDYDTPIPNLYPVLIDPGQNAVLWSHCLFPYFAYDFPFKDNPMRKNIQFPIEFSLLDNPRLKSSRANLLFDDDGYPCKEIYLIQNGKPSSVLIGRIENWNKLDGVTGRSRRSRYDVEPGIAPTNLLVPAGTDKPDDLLSAYGRMVWVERFGRIMCDYATGNFTALIEKGYWVEKGRRVKKLKNLVLTDNIFEFCKKIKGIGKDLKIDNSDGYYYNSGRPVVISYGMPTILISESLVTHFKRS